MKIKIIVIDPELSTRTKRILAAVAIPAVLLGGAAVAWAGPLHSWLAGDTLTAADLNGNFATLDARVTALEATAPTAWASYACNVVDDGTGVPVGGDTSTCFWRRNGSSVDVIAYSSFQAAPSSGHRMGYHLPPAVNPDLASLVNPARVVVGTGEITTSASGTTSAVLVALVGGATGLAFVYYAAPPGNNVLTSDAGVGAGTWIGLSFSFPIAP